MDQKNRTRQEGVARVIQQLTPRVGKPLRIATTLVALLEFPQSRRSQSHFSKIFDALGVVIDPPREVISLRSTFKPTLGCVQP